MNCFVPSSEAPRSWRQRGFTLIELMITVAVISILAAIAIPSYEIYIRKANRTDAKTALLDMAGRQESFFSVNNKYSSTASDLKYGDLPSDITVSGTANYRLSVTVPSGGASFTAKATPLTTRQQKDIECYTYQLDSTGVQSNLNSAGEKISGTKCW